MEAPHERLDVTLRYAPALLSPLNELRLSKTFTDCVLSADGVDFPVHAAVVAAASARLRASLTSGYRESRPTADKDGRMAHRLEMSGDLHVISSFGLQRMVEFMYSGVVEVSGGDVADVLNAAEFLELPFAYGAVVAYLLTQISASTWADVRVLGDRFVKPELSGAATEWAAAHFGQAAGDVRAWRAVPRAWVEELLAREELGGCWSEDEVLAAALVWAEGAEGGGAALPALLNLVRLPHISAAKALQLSEHALVVNSDASMDVLAELAAFNADASAVDIGLQQRWAVRTCFAGGKALVVISGDSVDAYRYDVISARWTDLPPMPSTREWSAGATLNGQVYFAGGNRRLDVDNEDDEEHDDGLSEVLHFDPAAACGVGAWAAVAPMATARYGAAAASLNGLLYVAGGWDVGYTRLSSVERYSPASNSWQLVASMATARYHHQLVAMGGALYAIGGSTDNDATNSVERFDPATNTWAAVASMVAARYGHAAAVIGGALYVAGGVGNGDIWLSSCERYDPLENTWSPIADLPEPRYGIALACLRGSLYAVGGDGADYAVSQSPPWRYDVPTNTWVVAPLAAGSPIKTISGGASWSAV